MRALAALGVLLLLATSAASLSTRPLAAQLSWHEGFGVGKIGIDGPAWALQLPIDPSLPAPQAALFLLEAAEIHLDGTYHDYVGSPQGMVQKDTTLHHDTNTLKDASLALEGVGAEAGFLLERGEGPGPSLHLQASSVVAKAEDAIRLELFPAYPGAPPHDLQRSTDLPGTGLGAGAEGLQEAFVVRGDFRIHLWDIDLRDPADGTAYRSGTDRTNTVGETDLTPAGVTYEARRQVLTLDVRDGRLSLAMPGRLLQAHFNPSATSGRSEGSWDVRAARGEMLYDGTSHAVQNTDVHLEGAFDSTFAADPDGAINARWTGNADTAGVARTTFAQELAKVPAKSAERTMWPYFAIAGLVVAGAGSGGVYVHRRARPSTVPVVAAPAAAPVTVPAAPEPVPEDDELMTRSIALLQDGRAAEVINALEPGYDAEEPVAAIKAYLLSLAYLKEEQHEAGLQWLLRAVHLYPEFGQEIPVNDAFASVRADPRLRRFTDQGATGYV